MWVFGINKKIQTRNILKKKKVKIGISRSNITQVVL